MAASRPTGRRPQPHADIAAERHAHADLAQSSIASSSHPARMSAYTAVSSRSSSTAAAGSAWKEADCLQRTASLFVRRWIQNAAVWGVTADRCTADAGRTGGRRTMYSRRDLGTAVQMMTSLSGGAPRLHLGCTQSRQSVCSASPKWTRFGHGSLAARLWLAPQAKLLAVQPDEDLHPVQPRTGSAPAVHSCSHCQPLGW